MLAIGSDHGGFELKKAVMKHLAERGVEYRDYGTFSAESCDYPDFGEAVGRAVASGECARGIVICGTGIGISIAANKVKGIRCGVCHDVFTATMCAEHNDANVISMGGRVVSPGLAAQMVAAWLDTPFGGGRHAGRVAKITAIENKYFK